MVNLTLRVTLNKVDQSLNDHDEIKKNEMLPFILRDSSVMSW